MTRRGHELIFGCRRLPKGQRRAELEACLDGVVLPSFPILPYDEAAATLHGQERARLDAFGRPTSFTDGQIAAIAQIHHLVLVTTNVAHFSPVRRLRIEDWSTPGRWASSSVTSRKTTPVSQRQPVSSDASSSRC